VVHKREAQLAAVALIVVLVGCTWISVLSGPRTLSVGDTATYVLSLGGDGTNQADSFSVVAEVPDSWSLLSSYYTGTIGGVPVSGTGTVESDTSLIDQTLSEGFQRFYVKIEEETEETDPDDHGEMTLDFDVVDIPDGEFFLKFWFIAVGLEPGMGPPAFAEINRVPHEYEFRGSVGVNDGALEDNFAVASSRDGRSVVLGGRRADISVLNRESLTGTLSHNHSLLFGAVSHSRGETVSEGVKDLVFAPDDRHVYGVDGRNIVCLERNTLTGKLALSQVLEDGVGGVDGLGGGRSLAISEDGASVYVAAIDDEAVSVFDRDPWSGDLSFVEAHFHRSGRIAGMMQPAALAVSPDGAHVYVAGNGVSSGCIVIFDRDPVDGTLTPTPSFCGLAGFPRRPWSIAVAPDGNHVYSVLNNDRNNRCGLAVLGRDPQNGRLSLVEVHEEGVDSVTGLIDPSDLALSPDGRYVFVSAHGSLVVFSRDQVTGSLSFENADFNSEGGVTGMPMPHQIALSPDGLDLFYGSSESLAVFSSRPRPLSQWP
jgi:DNA-binding beta-propeller fold protein YncE